ncbi:fungal-specific transcription factor domain-containing protein [Astrocystis sublimbata]|nr:fungal-specific transcription factor domain-containing protein [Astrocystis sublimbata]
MNDAPRKRLTMSSKPMTKSAQGCWTCKSRKIRCDQSFPSCRRCTQARRECEGYETRLSWPRESDKKRAILAGLQGSGSPIQKRHMRHLYFLNTTFEDIELYCRLSSLNTLRTSGWGLSREKTWVEPYSDITDTELLHYFQHAAHESLATFDPMAEICDVIIPLLFTGDTVSRRALLYALLAFSSLHHTGLQRRAMSLKVAALGALSASAKAASEGLVEAAQHIAACMLLCNFEILIPSENSGEWLLYNRGAKNIIESSHLDNQLDDGIIRKLLDWVYYHDAMSQFTLFHWQRKTPRLQPTTIETHTITPTTQSFPQAENRRATHFQSPSHTILNILSDVWEVLLDPTDPRTHAIEYRHRLEALEWKIDNLPSSASNLNDVEFVITGDELDVTVQLYQVATRIYLARASQSLLEAPVNLDFLVDKAYEGPVQNCHCRHFFPLLILACEARTDEQRAAILNLIDRTGRKSATRSMQSFRAQVQSFWIQSDLYADGDLVSNYLEMMKTVISSDRALPSYA